MVEEKIKNIIALYIKVPANEIMLQTLIDRSAVESSILLHRMYAHLLKENIKVENYWDVKTYGSLLQNLNESVYPEIQLTKKNETLENETGSTLKTDTLIGIDIEEIKQFPQVADYREDEFYTMNFAPSEISYCILQPNPTASFSGLFAAKEAIVKADNSYITTPFNSIVITHLSGGKPIYTPFQLSISHIAELAVAIAIKAPLNTNQNIHLPSSNNSNISNKNTTLSLLSYIAIILSIAAIIISFHKK